MKNKLTIKFLTLCLLALAVLPVMKAEYYLDTLFPIGLTGINNTGDNNDNCPYENANPHWNWDTEKELIMELGINCIGGQDSKPDYLVNLSHPNPVPDENSWFWKNYLHKVCKTLDITYGRKVYIITAGYFLNGSFINDMWTECPEKILSYNTVNISTNYPTASLFRASIWNDKMNPDFKGATAFQPGGYDRPLYEGQEYYCLGTEVDNWINYDGDENWYKLADNGAANFDSLFRNTTDYGYIDDYIWGFNLISEDPAVSREYKRNGKTEYWRGCWAAVDRVFTGHTRGKFSFDPVDYSDPGFSGGFRGVVFSDNKDRMILAKYSPARLLMGAEGEYNIFESLPDLDAFYEYSHYWCKPTFNYGAQIMFDEYLYGTTDTKVGRHYEGIFMQKFGKTPGGPPGQKRRMISVIELSWYEMNHAGTASRSRRPCPPEIRCAVYLSLSRGIKGILFHAWSFGTENNTYPTMEIPGPSNSDRNDQDGGFCLRDHQGYPVGQGGPDSQHHVLNYGAPQAPFWDHAPDNTYSYLRDFLIPEIKAIAPVLMQLDWVNGYSLNSTDPEWASPCPHDYVADVWGVSYMDLALFDHPYEPIGVEYFMLVNREGIADMTNRTVSVALDAGHWPQEDSLVLTDIAHKDSPQTLVRGGDRYVFTQVFEPGEGKLYRVAPVNSAPVAINNNKP